MIQVKPYVRIIDDAIALLDLNLSGLVVLTEAGSGPFLFTPLIAAKANAKKVFICIRDSVHGHASEIREKCVEALQQARVRTEVDFVLNRRPFREAGEADIITNSGPIRPLDQELLAHVKTSCVISLMYEKWELRASDLDVAYSRERGLKIAGTWENHPALRIFDYCEQLIQKMAFEAGYEIARNDILVWSNDHFGDLAVKGFKACGASAVRKIFSADELYAHASGADFVFFCDYLDQRRLIGPDAEVSLERVKALNDCLGIVHLSGDVDNDHAKSQGFPIYPDKRGHSVRMTFTLAHVGKRPVIYLNAAGLKVGECLSRGVPNKLVQLIE